MTNTPTITERTSACAAAAVRTLFEKKGKNIRMYELGELSSVTDVYINVTGRSRSHVGSLADDVTEALSAMEREPLHTEGRRDESWILVDYGDLIVNIFDEQSRDFYQLDRLMPESTLCDITPLKEEVDRKFDITAKEI